MVHTEKMVPLQSNMTGTNKLCNSEFETIIVHVLPMKRLFNRLKSDYKAKIDS